MNPDKTYTYDPKWNFTVTHGNHYAEHKDSTDAWTHGAVLGHSHDSQPAKWRLLPELPFWWFLNPWKHVEQLRETLRDTVNDCNDWHRRYDAERAASKADAAERDEATERLRDELDTMRSERDAANQAVRFLRNKSKKGKRRG